VSARHKRSKRHTLTRGGAPLKNSDGVVRAAVYVPIIFKPVTRGPTVSRISLPADGRKKEARTKDDATHDTAGDGDRFTPPAVSRLARETA
jgi:hypothetical protein